VQLTYNYWVVGWNCAKVFADWLDRMTIKSVELQKKVSTEGLELMCHLDTETWAISQLYKKVRFKAIYNVLALKNRTPRGNSSLMMATTS